MSPQAKKPGWDNFGAFYDEFSNESDRAAVILGAAKLDVLLYQLIQKLLVPTASSTDELLDGDSPLSTFSSRINMAYRLGVLDARFTRALHLVRRIRNSFAHELASSTLATGSHRDRVRELMAPFTPHVEYAGFREAFFPGQTGPGVDFRCVLGIMALRLEAAFDDVATLSSAGSWSLVPPHFAAPQEHGDTQQAAATNEVALALPVENAKPTSPYGT